jgi:hypothetical protein
MTAEEYRAEYETGYRTDVERITIEGNIVTFYENGAPLKGTYAYDGKEILTYKKGNRGVRFIFKKTEGDADAPQSFSSATTRSPLRKPITTTSTGVMIARLSWKKWPTGRPTTLPVSTPNRSPAR